MKCYDPYNNASGDATPTVRRNAGVSTAGPLAYGINPVMSGMMIETRPAEETAQTMRKSPGGENGVIQSCVAFLPTNSANAQSIGAEDELSPTLAKGGDEREVSPTLTHKQSALEPTLAYYNGVKCLNPQDQQTGRVYDPNGAMTSLQAGGRVSGQRRESVLMSDSLSQMRYIVRRITPTEAERLMGLPDGWTIPTGLRRFFTEDGEPSPELVTEFVERFDTFNSIMAAYEHKAPPKGKSRKQVADWLKKISCAETCPDSPRYKGCGNGQATNQPRWIVTRLLALGEGIDPFTGEEVAPCS